MNKMMRDLKDGMMLHGIAVGVIVCVITSLIGAAALGGLLLNETLSWKSVHVYAWLLLMLTSLLGTAAAEKVVGGKYAIVAVAVSGVYMLILVATTILFFAGMFDHVVGNVVAVLNGAAGACAICIRSGGRVNGKKRHVR